MWGEIGRAAAMGLSSVFATGIVLGVIVTIMRFAGKQ